MMDSITRGKCQWAKDLEYYERLSLEEKRKLYKCGEDYVTLDDIETWSKTEKLSVKSIHHDHLAEPVFKHSKLLNNKISLWYGDITRMEIDAIVNASNTILIGNAGMNGAIHGAAGSSLYEECVLLGSCDVGDAKITSGHALPAKYILHTVGPCNGCAQDLENCYKTCLDLVEKHNIKSVAFSCISTGKCEYDSEEAADVALGTVRKWLERNEEMVDRIIFCVFLEKDWRIYGRKLQQYFPKETGSREDMLRCKEGDAASESAGIMEIKGSSTIQSADRGERIGVEEVEKGKGLEMKAGSYGYVYEVKIWGTSFIAKKPHTIYLTETSVEEKKYIRSKFQEECILLSNLRHPNIVQFIGIYYSDIRKTDLILVMEKMDCDLLKFMCVYPGSELFIKLSILQDIASGLAYLHEHDPSIVHRDLTAMNILLTQFHRAKISDVGMSKLIDHNQAMASNHTCVPGQLFYMPPETRYKKPQCTPKLDIFSYGHLTLHLMLESFPEVYDLPYSELKKGMVERQRRETSLSAMGSGHCLFQLVIDCLKDEPKARPNARYVLDCIQQLKVNNK